MSKIFFEKIKHSIEQFKKDGVYKQLHCINSAQGPVVNMQGKQVIVMSSNNYLGLSNHPKVVQAARDALLEYGFGTSSVKFICGYHHWLKKLEEKTAQFFNFEASTSFTSCWNANEAVFQTLFGPEDLIVSDALNHASIIDGMKLLKSSNKKVYPHSDMKELRSILKTNSSHETKVIVSDGVFSMEGDMAKLDELVQIKNEFDAILVLDDSHGMGVLGQSGQGIIEHFGLQGQIDILTGTYGKALGGAMGGFICAQKDIIDFFVQRARPQLFSNSIAPALAAGFYTAIECLQSNPQWLDQLRENTNYFRKKITELGFKPLQGQTPIIPIIVGKTQLAIEMSQALLLEGVFVTGFGHPVVPDGHARLRIQISAAHTKAMLDEVLLAFEKVGRKMGLLKNQSFN